jgi:Ser/Thr protein kinase RdoA (MazF antagonist)
METTAVSLDAYKPLLANNEERRLVEHFESGYRERVLPMQGRLRRGVIHNDANRENVIVDAGGTRTLSIIDFGDMLDTWLVLEAAIAATYSMLQQADPLVAAQALVRGYHGVLALQQQEIEILFDLAGMRLCMSVCLCAHQQRLEPDNAYLSIDVEESWALLRQLQQVPAARARDLLMSACY